MKRILFNLKREWYEKIASGEKTVEYRRICEHWARRLGLPWPISDYAFDVMRKERFSYGGFVVQAVFRLGYSHDYPDIIRNIERVDVGTCPYKRWSGEYFRIWFGREGEK